MLATLIDCPIQYSLRTDFKQFLRLEWLRLHIWKGETEPEEESDLDLGYYASDEYGSGGFSSDDYGAAAGLPQLRKVELDITGERKDVEEVSADNMGLAVQYSFAVRSADQGVEVQLINEID